MINKECDLACWKAASQRWEAKPKPLLEDGTKVWTKSITLPLCLMTYCAYATLSSVSNLQLPSFHTMFGVLAVAPFSASGLVVVAISLSTRVASPVSMRFLCCVCGRAASCLLCSVLNTNYIKHIFLKKLLEKTKKRKSL